MKTARKQNYDQPTTTATNQVYLLLNNNELLNMIFVPNTIRRIMAGIKNNPTIAKEDRGDQLIIQFSDYLHGYFQGRSEKVRVSEDPVYNSKSKDDFISFFATAIQHYIDQVNFDEVARLFITQKRIDW